MHVASELQASWWVQENLFALSDIHPREELVMKYGGFVITGTLMRLMLQFLGLI
jgi:hypothetical protein